jgi:hypothetical protein
MKSDVEFQIVCIDCGCLAIRIEDPVTASHDAVVYCGDCGAPRGTVGALRNLALQPYAEIVLPVKSRLPSHRAAGDPRPVSEISKKYDELRSLRRKVELAESLACNSNRRRTRDDRQITPSPHLDAAKPYKTRAHKSDP